MAALMLHALWSARAAEFTVPEETIRRARGFLRERFAPRLKMFHNETLPSPSYGATATAVAALQQWGEHDSERVRSALSYLQSQPIEGLTADLRGTPFLGYARGVFHFELASHGIALFFTQDEKLLAAWLPKVRKSLEKQQAKDGSWDGWFGKPYGTAAVCLLLGVDRSKAWPHNSRSAKKPKTTKVKGR